MKSQSSTYSLVALLLVGLVTGCGPIHDNLEGSTTDGDKSVALKKILSVPQKVDFSQVDQFVLSERCVECHNPRDRKDNLDLSSYQAIFVAETQRRIVVPFDIERSSLLASLTIPGGKRHMPPLDRTQLSADQIHLVQVWIEHGAKEKVEDLPVQPPSLKEQLQPFYDQPELIDYSTVQNFVFKDNCIKCHSKDFPEVDRDVLRYNANLTNYQTIFHPTNPVVVKGNLNESKIYKAVSHSQSMPPGKEGYEPLSKWQVKLLRLWILNCAVEDHLSVEDDRRNNDPKNPEKVRLCEGQ